MSDSVVRRRLFWSLFIQSTEKWLGKMSLSGLHLCGLDRHNRFLFMHGEPADYKYRFSYVKINTDEKTIRDVVPGWEIVARHGRWKVYRNGKGKIAATGMPNRRGLYLRNNSFLCLYALLSSIAILLLFAVSFAAFALMPHISGENFFRNSIAVIGIFAFLLLCNFMFFLYMTSANSKILEDPNDAIAPETAYHQFLNRKTFERWLEKLLIKDGDIIKRFRPFLLLTPSSLEKWLFKMEIRGFNLYKIHKSGALFYFVKSTPRKIKYCVVSNESGNVARFIAAGWQVVFSTSWRIESFGRIAVISRACDDESEPSPFNNEKDFVSNAFHLTLKFVLLYFLLLVIAIVLLLACAYFDVGIAAIWVVGIVLALSVILIVKILFYLVSSVIYAKKRKMRLNGMEKSRTQL